MPLPESITNRLSLPLVAAPIVQSRVLLGAINVHQSATTTTGNSAATSPLKKGRTIDLLKSSHNELEKRRKN
jgi:hypothetical protein